jgi:hypothetical protein
MNHALVPALWAAVAVLALPEALLFPDAAGPAYLAVNVFVFFGALLLLAHAASRRNDERRMHHADYLLLQPHAQPLEQPHQHDPTICCPPKTHAHTELAHLFIHVLCLAYVRAACWFEFRALAASVAPTQSTSIRATGSAS